MDPDTSCGAANIVSPVRQIHYDVVGSTNAEALVRARAGDLGPLWITARVQTAGRGRRGRTWTSPSGNLYATLLLGDPGPAAVAPQLSFVAALAVHDAIVAAAGQHALSLMLKWPNDVLCNDAKLAGILIEGEGRPLAVAIGIGVNCRQTSGRDHLSRHGPARGWRRGQPRAVVGPVGGRDAASAGTMGPRARFCFNSARPGWPGRTHLALSSPCALVSA